MSVPHSPRQRLDGVVPVVIGGVEHQLRFTMESMAALETAESHGNVDRLLALLWACLLPLQPDIDIERLEETLDYADMQPVSAAVQRCLKLCLPAASTKRASGGDSKPAKRSNWARLWSYARLDLGLSWAEFWGMTPRLYDALSERQRERQIDGLTGYAMVMALYANTHRDKKQRPEPFTPEDFLPARGQQAKAQPQVVKDMQQRSKEIFQSLGARTIRVKPALPDFSKKNNG